MAQIFSPSADTWLRVAMVATAGALVVLLLIGGGVVRSDYMTGRNVTRDQPVPFSHQHHVAGLGLDCRYCHTSVEVSATAGFPPTDTCMTCHSQIWTNAAVLEPVRRSLATDQPLQWTWVNKLPLVRLLQPQHSHRQGCRLRDLPRPGGHHAPDAPGGAATDAVVPRLPPEPGTAPAPAPGRVRHELDGAGRRRRLGQGD